MTEQDPDQLHTVATASSSFEAQLLTTVLDDEGIEAFAFDHIRNALPLDLKFTRIPVQVRRDDLDRAQEVLQRNRRESQTIDWTNIELGQPPPHAPSSGDTVRPRTRRRIFIAIGAALILLLLIRLLQAAIP